MSHQGANSERDPEHGTRETVLAKESHWAGSPHGQSCVCRGGTGVDTRQEEGAAVISEACREPARGAHRAGFVQQPREGPRSRWLSSF